MDAKELAAHITAIEVYGYTIVPEVLSRAACDQMRATLLECNRRFGEGHSHRTSGEGARHVSNLPTLARCFHPIIDHPRILPLIEHFMGPDIILGSLNSRIVRPGDPQQDLHADVGGKMRTTDRSRPLMMNTVWMLQETGPSNGGTRVVPGSHMCGMDEPPDGWHPPLIVQPQCPVGSCLVYNGHCWHAGGASTSDVLRCSLFGHYRRSLTAYPEFGGRVFQCDPSAGFPNNWRNELSDMQKQLLGMTGGLGLAGDANHDHIHQGTFEPQTHWNGDFGGHVVRAATNGARQHVLEVPGFATVAGRPLVEGGLLCKARPSNAWSRM